MNVVLPCNSKVRWEKSQFILVGVSTTLKWFTVNFSPCLRKQLKLLERLNLKYPLLGNSLEFQWLGLYTFTAGTPGLIQSLAMELRSCKTHNMAKNKQTNKKNPLL